MEESSDKRIIYGVDGVGHIEEIESYYIQFANGMNLYTVEFWDDGIRIRKTNIKMKEGMKITPEVSNVIRIV